MFWKAAADHPTRHTVSMLWSSKLVFFVTRLDGRVHPAGERPRTQGAKQ